MSKWDYVQKGVTVLGLILLFQGRGSHGVFIGVWLLLPLVRLFSARYRARWKERTLTFLTQIVTYRMGTGKFPWRLTVYFVALPVFVLNLLNGRSIVSLDVAPTLLMSQSLVNDFNVELSEFTPSDLCEKGVGPEHYYLSCRENGIYSSYPFGMVLFQLPAAVLHKITFGVSSMHAQWRISKVMAGFIAAISALLFFYLALYWVPVPSALLGTVLFAFGSALFSTVGQGLWTQSGVVFFLLLFLVIEKSQGSPILGGLCIAAMFACRLTSILLWGPFLLWTLFRSPKRVLVIGTTLLLALSPLLWMYQEVYGHWGGPQLLMGKGEWTTHPLNNLAGLLFSPGRGLFIYQPWLVLLALYPSVRKKDVFAWTGPIVVATVASIILVASWPQWHGGHSWGSRLLSETVPLLALMCLFPIDALWKKGYKKLLLALVTLSTLMHIPYVFFSAGNWNHGEQFEVHLWDWAHPPFLFWFE